MLNSVGVADAAMNANAISQGPDQKEVAPQKTGHILSSQSFFGAIPCFEIEQSLVL